MAERGPLIRNISETALWVAVYRARETERPDAAFRDQFARRLAGPRGEEIARSFPFSEDIASPGLMKMIQRDSGAQLSAAGAELKFGPAEGPGFFVPHGWKPADVRSPLKTAARLKRLSFGLRLAAMLPESSGPQGSRPWSGVCLLERA